MGEKQKKASFTSSLGFILAAAGSAVGLGNIWRFPYLAANGGGGLFLIIYLVLVLTFGYTLLSTDLIIGRKTKMNAINAFAAINKKFKFVGVLSFIVPCIILSYYCVIGGWVLKYFTVYATGGQAAAAADGYFSGFITSNYAPVFFMLLYIALTAIVVYNGVEKGVERFSKYVMPGLIVMIIGIAVFSICLSHTTADGITRTGLEGLAVYLIPNFEGIGIRQFLQILLSALSQLFYSLSVSMGIMITYGAYVKDEENLSKSVVRIEIFDTAVAVLAGAMVIPAIYVFSGLEGMKSGPGLMFVALPQVFLAMGNVGKVIGLLFFIMVAFAALTSSVSIMETIVATCMEKFNASRKKVSLVVAGLCIAASVVVCMGYNVMYFEVMLPTGGNPGQLLDILDYVSNNLLMPFVSLCTCLIIGWYVKPKWAIEEMEKGGHVFKRKNLYTIVIRYIAPILLFVLFLQAIGALNWLA